MTPSLRRSYEDCRALTRRHARSFSAASWLLPPERRRAAFALYAFCRSADDALDETAGTSGAERSWYLCLLRQRLDAIYEGRVEDEGPDLALADAVGRFEVPKSAFLDLLRGLEIDLEPVAFQTTRELLGYAHLVGGVVGDLLLPVLGASGAEARDRADDLGIAMQLTNILRDVGEDLGRDRIYLPEQELQAFGLSHDDVRTRRVDDRWRAFMRWQIDRARAWYRRAAAGIPLIGTWAGRAAAQSMSLVYGGILSGIERNDFDVFCTRASTSRTFKLLGVLRAVQVTRQTRRGALPMVEFPALPSTIRSTS